MTLDEEAGLASRRLPLLRRPNLNSSQLSQEADAIRNEDRPDDDRRQLKLARRERDQDRDTRYEHRQGETKQHESHAPD